LFDEINNNNNNKNITDLLMYHLLMKCWVTPQRLADWFVVSGVDVVRYYIRMTQVVFSPRKNRTELFQQGLQSLSGGG